MSQFSLFDIEPTKPDILPVDTSIKYKNGSHVIKGKVLDGKHDGKYQLYQVQADMDEFGYSIQWIYDFQIQ